MATGKKPPEILDLAPINRRRVLITVEGESRLVTNQFSAKAKQMMLDKMMGKITTKTPREKRNPASDYEGSKYLNEQGQCCVRAISFKCAMLDAAIEVPGLTGPRVKRLLHVTGELLPIEGCEPHMREDAVTVVSAMGKVSHDLRYRAEFWPWSIKVPIVFDGDGLSLDQVMALLDRAGFGAGIGEYRVQRKGNWGMFRPTEVVELR